MMKELKLKAFEEWHQWQIVVPWGGSTLFLKNRSEDKGMYWMGCSQHEDVNKEKCNIHL